MSPAHGRPAPDALDRLTAMLDGRCETDDEAGAAPSSTSRNARPVAETPAPGAAAPRAARSVMLDVAVVRILAGLVVVAVAAAGVAGFLFFRGRPAPVVAARPTLSVSGGASGTGSPSGAPTALVVAVAGAVRRPGVVRLPPGSRVIDAIAAAGGAKPGTDLATVNLAAKLTDGQQVVVGAAGAVGAGAGAAAGAAGGGGPGGGPGGVLDLNAATADQLDGLPGVGPVTAQRIVAWRTAHGGFQRVDQLQDVPGIGPSKFAQLKDLVSL